KPGRAAAMGPLARAALDTYAPEGRPYAQPPGLSVSPTEATELRKRVMTKLEREPVEDYRIDFEDGYGVRPDEEEDAHAEAAGITLEQGRRDGTLPPFPPLRLNPFIAPPTPRPPRPLHPTAAP